MVDKTPLMLACEAGDEEAVERILKELGDTVSDHINHQDMYGYTAFCYAVYFEYEEIAVQLIDHGADVTLGVGEERRPPLRWAIGRDLDVVAKRIIQEVSQDYINTCIESYMSTSILSDAIVRKRVDIACCLIDHGADVKLVKRNGMTPLMEAASFGLYVVVERILKELGDTLFEHINLKDKNGWTALSCACLYKHVDIVRLLLEHGADPRISWQPDLILGIYFQSTWKKAMDEPHRSSMSSP